MNARDVIEGVIYDDKRWTRDGGPLTANMEEDILDALHSAAGGRWIVIDAETGRVGHIDDGWVEDPSLVPDRVFWWAGEDQ